MATMVAVAMLGMVACQKKGDFIAEDQLGSGMHYYPVILNETYFDTLTHHYMQDTSFAPGQALIFELKYHSQDSLSRIGLWFSEKGKKAQPAWDTAYSDSFYSEFQDCDTTLVPFVIPEDLDTTITALKLFPRVVTQKGLVKESQFTIQIQH